MRRPRSRSVVAAGVVPLFGLGLGMSLGACEALTGDAFDVSLAGDGGALMSGDGRAGSGMTTDGGGVGETSTMKVDTGTGGGGTGIDASDAADAALPPNRIVSAGGTHECAVQGGAATCWGEGDHGELGYGTAASKTVPVAVTGLGAGVVSIAAGGSHSCAVLATGVVECWGANDSGQCGQMDTSQTYPAPVMVNVSGAATAVVAGQAMSCALLQSGNVECWGANDSGQLGVDSTTASSTPAQVKMLSAVTALSAGQLHVCAVASSKVYCWGSNHYQQIGDGLTVGGSTTALDDHLTPTAVVGGPTNALAVAAGAEHSCALTTMGAVSCWGSDNADQLGSTGIATTSMPQPVTGLTDATAIAAGDEHTCVLRPNGVYCWGQDNDGQLGFASSGSGLGVGVPQDPVSLGAATSPVSLTAGGNDTCVMTEDGHAYGWGDNGENELGDGSDEPSSAMAVQVNGL